MRDDPGDGTGEPSTEWARKQARWNALRPTAEGETAYVLALWIRTKRMLTEAVQEFLDEEPGLVVDVGNNSTSLALHLDPAPEALIAVDPDPSPLSETTATPGAFAVASLAEALPLPDRSARVVCFKDSLDHVSSAPAALLEAIRVLKPGGGLIITLSNRHSLLRGVRRARDLVRRRASYDHLEQHMVWYTTDAVSTLCTAAGLEVQRATGVGYVPLAYEEESSRGKILNAVEKVCARRLPTLGDQLFVVAVKP